MSEVITIGLDIAKHVFQVHGVDEARAIVIRRKLRRAEVLRFFEDLPSCLVGIEACATAHYWARSIMALGHRVNGSRSCGLHQGQRLREPRDDSADGRRHPVGLSFI